MGEPKTGKREPNSGIARADWSCYWVSPCGWKRVGPTPIIVVVVEFNIFLYIIIVVTPSAPSPLPLQWEHHFFIFIALAAARAHLQNQLFTTTKFCLSPIALLS